MPPLSIEAASTTVDKEAKDLPCLSVLVNRKAVKAHVRLVVFIEMAQKEVQQEAHLGRKESTDF